MAVTPIGDQDQKGDKRQERADHEDVAVREIDHTDNAVDHRVADGDQAIDRTERNAVDELLDEVFHASAALRFPAQYLTGASACGKANNCRPSGQGEELLVRAEKGIFTCFSKWLPKIIAVEPGTLDRSCGLSFCRGGAFRTPPENVQMANEHQNPQRDQQNQSNPQQGAGQTRPAGRWPRRTSRAVRTKPGQPGQQHQGGEGEQGGQSKPGQQGTPNR